MGDDGTNYKMPYQRPDLNVNWVEAPGHNMTPMQAQIHNQGIDHNNWQTPGSKALYPGRVEEQQYEYVDHSKSAGRSFDPNIAQSEEDVIRNRAETQMTSNMIKNSLAELRSKLTQMKVNKDFVRQGMSIIDAKK